MTRNRSCWGIAGEANAIKKEITYHILGKNVYNCLMVIIWEPGQIRPRIMSLARRTTASQLKTRYTNLEKATIINRWIPKDLQLALYNITSIDSCWLYISTLFISHIPQPPIIYLWSNKKHWDIRNYTTSVFYGLWMVKNVYYNQSAINHGWSAYWFVNAEIMI